MHYNWDWGVLIRAPYGDWLLTGAGWSLALTLVSWTIALLIGSVIGCLRSAGSRLLRLPATLFVELFRNVPPLVQLFLWFFAFPEILPTALGMWVKRDLPLPSFSTAAVAIGLFAAARVAEQVRAGIGSVRTRLLPAALATGMRPWQAYRLVLLPVAFRIIMAPLTSEFLITFKMSSIALTIGVLEVSAQAQQISNYTFHGFEAYAAATVFYLVVGLMISLLMTRLDTRLRRGVGAKG